MGLELKSNSKPQVEGEVERSRLQEVHIVNASGSLTKFLRLANLRTVKDVEEVTNKLDRGVFRYLPSIVSMSIESIIPDSASQFATTSDGAFSRIQVGRVS